MQMDLSEFVRSVRAIEPAHFDQENLGKLLRDVRLEEQALRPFAARPGSGYTRTLVYAEAAYEILLLRWSAGARTPIHDHAGQHCWFTSVKGCFDLANYRLVSGGQTEGHARIEALSIQPRVGIGVPDFRSGDEEIHSVTVSSGCEEAVSLHVYAQPLRSCLVFDERANRCASKPLAYDAVLQDGITLASA